MKTAMASPDMSALTARWWAFIIRGIAAILFGVVAIVAPGISLFALVVVWGAYAVVDGVLSLIHAARGDLAGQSWGWMVFSGIVGILAGAVAFLRPAMTAFVLLMVIAVWAVLTGTAEIAAAIRLRKEIKGEWLLIVSGVLSIMFGAVLIVNPSAGALAMLWVISAYAIVFGALTIGLGLRLRLWKRQSHERHIPTGAAPTPA